MAKGGEAARDGEVASSSARVPQARAVSVGCPVVPRPRATWSGSLARRQYSDAVSGWGSCCVWSYEARVTHTIEIGPGFGTT